MKKIQIDLQSTASHEVDPQKGFTPLCPNELPVKDGHTIANELNRQAKFGSVRTISKDVHPSNAIWISNNDKTQFTKIENEPNVDIVWNAHCMSGTKGAELIDGLPHLSKYNFIVFKGVEPDFHPYSGVYHDNAKLISTGLKEYYDMEGIMTVIVGGLALDFCVFDTVKDLINNGMDVIVNLSATKAIGDVKETVKKLKDIGAIIINSVDDLEII